MLMMSSCKNMGNRFRMERLMHRLRSRRLLSAVAILTVHAILSQFLAIPLENYISSRSYVDTTSTMLISASDSKLSNKKSQFASFDIFQETADLDSNEGAKQLLSELLISDRKLTTDELGKMKMYNRTENNFLQEGLETEFGFMEQIRIQLPTFLENDTRELNPDAKLSSEEFRNGVEFPSPKPFANHSDTSLPYDELLRNGFVSSNISSAAVKKGSKMTTISSMKTLLLQGSPSSNSKRPHQLSSSDQELVFVRHQIENAPIIRDAPKTYASLFRNYSTFISYELMEQMLKVYIYEEGEKPVFHFPYLRGIYSSEGWFKELIERNKQYVVQDPTKAHLFYLSFSLRRLRNMVHQQNPLSNKDRQNLLDDYIQNIAAKYSFWNRTKGADNFMVACHDGALRFTKKSMRSCIRAVCNANLAKGFEMGKDVSLPATMVHDWRNPLEDFGDNSPQERHILAFFAGSMHGNLRQILLKHWNNKTSDMIISGPLGHDAVGVARYKEFMRSSRYCICAKGHEVYSPRVIESIHYECVPVIISDNYVPPLFDVFEWESFAVFVLEEDIPNLRNILLSIPEEKYTEMQYKVKLVQQHFLWHKEPVKFDIFHMILHSIWYKRVLQV